ncbi:MAG: hypothetical protein MUF85_01355 [Patescibacteria group bacterium]|jgi:hypothetical protein|nr:hypothetical protein [Patescibacteria group bacterium]
MALRKRKISLYFFSLLIISSLVFGILQNTVFAYQLSALGVDDRIKVRNLAIIFEKCYSLSGYDDRVSQEEVNNGRWLASGTGSDHIVAAGILVDSVDGIVDCAGDDANWMQQFMTLASYGSLAQAFNDLSKTKAPGDTDPLGYLKPMNEIKTVLNGRFGYDIWTLGSQDYLTYRSNFLDWENTCQAQPVTQRSNVGIYGEIWVVRNNQVEKQLYSYQDNNVYNRIGEEKFGRNNDTIDHVKCSELLGYLATKSHADAYLASLATLPSAPPVATPGGAADPSSGVSDGDGSCEASMALGWIVCAIGEGLSHVTRLIDGTMYDLLYINTEEWNEDSGVYVFWGVFRTLATTLLVVIALVAIASQIFNFNFLSAYTVKKVLPKIIIAAIAIQLSFFLAKIAVDISNTIGYSIQSLMSAPFERFIDTSASPDGWISFQNIMSLWADNTPAIQQQAGAAAAITATGLAGLFVAAPALIALGGGIIGSATAGPFAVVMLIIATLVPAVIALIIAYATLVLRVAIIIGLIAVLPLAIIAWILPNTEKWWKQWWGMFFAALIMFPVIIATLTFGKLVAVMFAINNSGGLRPIITLFAIIIAYFLPYFLIFKMIKFSGGALGKLQGVIDNTKSKISGNEGLKTWRQRKKESAKYYSDERARSAALGAQGYLDDKDNKNKRFRRAWNRRVLSNAQSRLGNSGYYGELQEAEMAKILDKAKSDAEGQYTRAEASVGQNNHKKFNAWALTGLDENGEKKDTFIDEDTNAEIKWSEELQAAAVPKGLMFKHNDQVKKVIAEGKNRNDGTGAVIRRFAQDNQSKLDELMPSLTRGRYGLEEKKDKGVVVKDKQGKPIIVMSGSTEKSFGSIGKINASSDEFKEMTDAHVKGLTNDATKQRALDIINSVTIPGTASNDLDDYEKALREIDENLIDKGTIAMVKVSDGNLKLGFDPTGKIIAVKTDLAP